MSQCVVCPRFVDAHVHERVVRTTNTFTAVGEAPSECVAKIACQTRLKAPTQWFGMDSDVHYRKVHNEMIHDILQKLNSQWDLNVIYIVPIPMENAVY